jgi:hypothetical protein
MPVILATWEAEIRIISILASLSKKVSRPHPVSTHSWAQWHIPVIPSYMGG